MPRGKFSKSIGICLGFAGFTEVYVEAKGKLNVDEAICQHREDSKNEQRNDDPIPLPCHTYSNATIREAALRVFSWSIECASEQRSRLSPLLTNHGKKFSKQSRHVGTRIIFVITQMATVAAEHTPTHLIHRAESSKACKPAHSEHSTDTSTVSPECLIMFSTAS